MALSALEETCRKKHRQNEGDVVSFPKKNEERKSAFSGIGSMSENGVKAEVISNPGSMHERVLTSLPLGCSRHSDVDGTYTV